MKSLEAYLLNHPKHTLIFDFDRTLVALDFPRDIFRMGMRASLRSFDPELIKIYDGKGQTMEMINAIIGKHGEPARLAVIEYSTYFETHYGKHSLPNIPLIHFIKQHAHTYHYALWSSNTSATLTKWLMHYRLSNHFHTIVNRDRVKFVKPNPEGFYDIYDPSRSKDEYLMLGDSKRDKEAALAAGIDFFQIKMETPFDPQYS